mgnify:FL=1
MTQKLDFAAMPHPQRLQWLAERKKLCPGIPDEPGEGFQGGGRVCQNGRSIAADESDMGICVVCRGSSTVLLLKGLRTNCPYNGERRSYMHARHLPANCLGWILADDAEHLLLGELAKAGLNWVISSQSPDKYGASMWSPDKDSDDGDIYEEAQTWESALSLAACRAVEASL